MKFLVLSQVLLAASAVAVPSGHGLASRVSRRSGRDVHRLTHPKIPAPIVPGEEKHMVEQANRAHVDYSSNWSGAVLTAPPSNTTFTSVSAQFEVPTPKLASGVTADSSASAWVGIDGDTYSAAILQTGVDFSVSASGHVSYDAWYEWYPDYAYDFSGIDISAGDVIKTTVTSSSNSAGTCVIENLTTGQKVSQDLTAPSSDAHLGGQNAEWIVEDFEQNGSQVPFANFGTVKFMETTAGVSDGSAVSNQGADILVIQQNNVVLTDVQIPSSSEVDVSYVGP